jgi:hypothetical protein
MAWSGWFRIFNLPVCITPSPTVTVHWEIKQYIAKFTEFLMDGLTPNQDLGKVQYYRRFMKSGKNNDFAVFELNNRLFILEN